MVTCNVDASNLSGAIVVALARLRLPEFNLTLLCAPSFLFVFIYFIQTSANCLALQQCGVTKTSPF